MTADNHPDLDITAIRERAEKATEGPWEIVGGNEWLTGVDIPVGSPPDGSLRIEDAEFVAHAREDIPALLAALESSRAEAKELDTHLTTTCLDYAQAKAELAASRAVVERLQGELDAQTVEWGVRHDGDYGVIPAPGIEYAERMVRIAPRHTAVSRKVGPWLPVPTDGAEN